MLSMQLLMYQGKVHAKSSYYKKVSWSYYEKPLQKEMTFAKILSPYHQRLHTPVTPLAVLEDMHKKSTPSFRQKNKQKKKTGHCATLIQGPYLTERPQPPS